MKTALFLLGISITTAITTTITTRAEAAEFLCSSDSTHEWVRLVAEPGESRFSYGKFDDEILAFNLKDEAVETVWPDRRYLDVEPMLGETFARVYLRIAGDRAVFDIYQYGVNGPIQTAASDATCLVFD